LEADGQAIRHIATVSQNSNPKGTFELNQSDSIVFSLNPAAETGRRWHWSVRIVRMMGWVFAIVIAAIAGSFVQDLFLPGFLRRPEEPPMKTEPEVTEPSILATVLEDMESLDLIKLSPNADKKPFIEGKAQTEDQHISEKAAA
jgi:hypothetical protein